MHTDTKDRVNGLWSRRPPPLPRKVAVARLDTEELAIAKPTSALGRVLALVMIGVLAGAVVVAMRASRPSIASPTPSMTIPIADAMRASLTTPSAPNNLALKAATLPAPPSIAPAPAPEQRDDAIAPPPATKKEPVSAAEKRAKAPTTEKHAKATTAKSHGKATSPREKATAAKSHGKGTATKRCEPAATAKTAKAKTDKATGSKATAKGKTIASKKPAAHHPSSGKAKAHAPGRPS